MSQNGSSWRPPMLPTEAMARGIRPGLDSGLIRQAASKMLREFKPARDPLRQPPCANANATTECPHPATKVCSSCKLATYCSTGCQSAHWKSHKKDCKSPLLSDAWKPIWEVEDRQPDFSEGGALRGSTLWSTMPPIDILNLPSNEGSPSKDLAIAFLDTVDLKNVLKTINALPPTFTGTLDVLINVPSTPSAFLLLFLLLILGSPIDSAVAVDMALHHWFSVFEPSDYARTMMMLQMESVASFTQRERGQPGMPVPPLPIGSTGSNVLLWGPPETPYFRKLDEGMIMSAGVRTLKYPEARVAYEGSRSGGDDDWDRVLASLTPAHRLAFKRYRDTGIVLPFGASTARFTGSNVHLVAEDRCCVPPLANPLQGWDMDEVITTGTAHGARPEDIFGCLHFYLTDVLSEFRRRIRDVYKVHFGVYLLDTPEDFAKFVSRAMPNMRFDRVDVGGLLDSGGPSVEELLEAWAPLLAEGKDAAVVGYCREWARGDREGPGDALLEPLKPNERPFSSDSACHNADAGSDNSAAFDAHLRRRGMDAALEKTGLKMRERRRVVPHRLGLPLDAAPSDTPVLGDEEGWYRATMVGCRTWTERYLELGRE